jgi:HAD superfamily hydrolase (TIGR01509 family)
LTHGRRARRASGAAARAAPDALLFDLGEVLVALDRPGYAAAFAALGAERQAALDFLDSPVAAAWNQGSCQPADFAAALRRTLGLACRQKDLRAAWESLIGAARPGMLALAEEARRGGLRVALLSNTDPWHWARARQRCPQLGAFDGLGLSFELGALKPQPACFAAAEAALGLDPARTLFVDDRRDNLATAQGRGYEVWHHAPGRPEPEDALRRRVLQLLEES